MNRMFRLFEPLQVIRPSVRSKIAWGYCALLIYLLITPSPLSPFGGWGRGTEEVIDSTFSSYIQHVFAYMILVSLFWWSLSPIAPKSSWRLAIASSLHGSVFEGLQYFVPSRECDWKDLSCNLLGVALGWGMMWMASSFGKDVGVNLPPDLETAEV